MGGYGVYQGYRRMIREERTDHGAEYLIFYIWGDDHIPKFRIVCPSSGPGHL